MSRICVLILVGSMGLFFSVAALAQKTDFIDSTTDRIVLVQQNGTGSGLVAISPGSSPLPFSFDNIPPVAIEGIATALTGSTAGVFGVASSSDSAAGVLGASTATSGHVGGVFGVTQSTDGTGVEGVSLATSGNTIGVQGDVASPNGIAVNAIANATTGTAIGVRGQVSSPNATAGVFSNQAGGPILDASTGTNRVFAVDGAGLHVTDITPDAGSHGGFLQVNQGLQVNGSGLTCSLFPSGCALAVAGNAFVGGGLQVLGVKSSVVKLDDGRLVGLYAVESPENWFEDFGAARLTHGVAKVDLEPTFAETVNASMDYHVFLTANGNCRGLYVAQKTPTGFEVRELRGGKSNVTFDYRIVARRRGYETVRLGEVPADRFAERASARAPAAPASVGPR